MSAAVAEGRLADEAAANGRAHPWAAVLIFALVFLQKFAIPLGATQISVLVPLLLLAVCGLALSSCLAVHDGRVALFLAFLAVAMAGQALMAAPMSLPSILLLLALYAPMCFFIPLSGKEWSAIRETFQNAVLVIAWLVWVQLVWQFALGEGNTLNLEDWLPDALLLDGYVYDMPFRWGAQFVRPNGLFMLEPSFASLFLACTLIVELQESRRPLRLAIFGSALLGTFAGTGLMAIAVAAPLLFIRLPLGRRFMALLVIAVGGAAAVWVGIFDVFAGRLGEFTTPGSSVWLRFVQPFHQVAAILQDQAGLFTGIGAGNVSDTDMNAWPLVKLALEYGLVAAILFMAFLVVSVWNSPAPVPLAALLVAYNFSGGYLLSPVLPLLLVIFGTLPRVTGHPTSHRHSAEHAQCR